MIWARIWRYGYVSHEHPRHGRRLGHGLNALHSLADEVGVYSGVGRPRVEAHLERGHDEGHLAHPRTARVGHLLVFPSLAEALQLIAALVDDGTAADAHLLVAVEQRAGDVEVRIPPEPKPF